MKSPEDNNQLIERYLDGELDKAELQAFEAQVSSDQELASELQLARQARHLVSMAGRSHLSDRLDAFEKEVKEEEETPEFKAFTLPTWMKVAAAAITILMAGWWFYEQPFSSSQQDLFASHFEPYRNPINLRDTESLFGTDWQQAVELYSKGDFENAIPAFKKELDKQNTVSYLSHFYLGISALAKATPDPQQAINAFDQVLASDNDYHQQANWYKGLALLKKGAKKEAREIFEGIIENGHYQKEKAAMLLRDL